MASIFDMFSTGPAEAAAQAQQQAAQNAYTQYAGLNQQAIDQLRQQYGAAGGFINQFYPQAQAAVSGATPQAAQALQSNYGAGLAPTMANVGTANQGTTQLLAALGLGPTGAAGIQDVLSNTPGYQFAVQQATDAVNRNNAASGSLASGKTNLDLSNYITNLASQNYNSYVQQLQPFLGYGTSNAANALQGYSGLGGNLANLYTGQGGALAGLLSGQGGALASNAQNLGTGVAGLLGGQANAAYGTQANIGNAQAQAALAPYTVGNNAMNAVGNAVKLGTSLFGAFA